MLEKILLFIQEKIREYQTLLAKSDQFSVDVNLDHQQAFNILTNIENLLLTSPDKPDSITSVLEYIERLPVISRNFFGFVDTYPFGNALEDSGEPVLESDMNQMYSSKAIDSESGLLNALGRVHVSLMPLREEVKKKTAWTYSYPVTAEGIQHPAIQQWKNTMLSKEQNRDAVYNDLTRDFRLNGRRNYTQGDIDRNLTDLLNLTQYSPPHKAIIKEWIKNNGGQDMNRLIDLLVHSNQFTPGGDQDSAPDIGVTTKVRWQNWCAKNGAIHFNFVYGIKALSYGVNGWVLYSEKAGKVGKYEDVEAAAPKGLADLPVLMHARGDVELQIKDGKVDLKVTGCGFTSYTPYLKKPAIRGTQTYWDIQEVKREEMARTAPIPPTYTPPQISA